MANHGGHHAAATYSPDRSQEMATASVPHPKLSFLGAYRAGSTRSSSIEFMDKYWQYHADIRILVAIPGALCGTDNLQLYFGQIDLKKRRFARLAAK
jgi:hypothetical protein